MILTADRPIPTAIEIKNGRHKSESKISKDAFGEKLESAAQAFVVRRDKGKTVIAGYPWFLDWGRDSLICARGLLAARMVDEVRQLLLTFARFEKDGTLPNTIHGDDVSNRDTSDAPLWFAVACEELALVKHDFHSTTFDSSKRDGARSFGKHRHKLCARHAQRHPHGHRLRAHLESEPFHLDGHELSRRHAARRLSHRDTSPLDSPVAATRKNFRSRRTQKNGATLADHAAASLEKLFWLEDKGWFADVLPAKSNVIARDAAPGDELRSNCLFAVSLGLVTGERAKRCVAAAQKYLVVPGALRTLAPLPVSIPLPVSRDGHSLNDPRNPYWPRYEGDEDTRRKPAYHNGTAWTWTFPVFCEALARAWDFSPEAVAAAKAYLGSSEKILSEGCLGQLPEILDGDAPHTQRGCDAQAWGATEAVRVWKLLSHE